MSTFVRPSLSAANNRHRLLSDFDPGNVTVPSRLLMGFTVNVSGGASDVDNEDGNIVDDINGCVSACAKDDDGDLLRYADEMDLSIEGERVNPSMATVNNTIPAKDSLKRRSLVIVWGKIGLCFSAR